MRVVLAAALLSLPAAAGQPPTVARIGVLNPQTASASLEDALRQGLSQLGYVEGKNIVIEWRRAAGRVCLGAADPEGSNGRRADSAGRICIRNSLACQPA